MKHLLFGAICVLALGCSESRPPAGVERSTTTAEPADAANTGVNVRDRDSMAKTPMDQNENAADIKTTADIRKRVVDANMSVDANNIKIITQDGKVTLRGPVKTEEEKQRIGELARDIAGTTNVDNQLDVASEGASAARSPADSPRR